MSTGNIFQLLINDTKTDSLLNASKYLTDKLDSIYTKKLQNCKNDLRTRFASAEERGTAEFREWSRDPDGYCAERAQVTSATLSELSRTHTIYIGACYKPYAATAFTYLKINEKQGSQAWSNEIAFTIPQGGTWIHDMVLHVRLTGLRATSPLDKVKYCSFVGHRMIDTVQFIVNDTVLAEYTTEMYNKYYNFNVPLGKRSGWMRNVGQEQPKLAYVTPDPARNEYREYRWFGDGPQTFKREHTEVDMYIPLLFWFNLDVAQAFPNVKIPKGKVQIKIKFADLGLIVAAADYGGGGAYQAPAIATADLHVNHISTLPSLSNLILNNSDLTLVRVNKIQEQIVTHTDAEILLKNLKFPTEHMAFCFRPLVNYTDVDNWYRNSVLTPNNIMVPVAVLTSDPTPVPVLAINSATYLSEDRVVDQCGLNTKSLEIFQYDTTAKYSNFYPFAANGFDTPDESGWMLLNFQLKPTDYNPSGHIDLTKNRELYLKYSSSYITDATRAKLVIVSQAINFLICKAQSAYMRYI